MILLVTNSSYGFSQTDTTKVILPTPTARLVIKDLIQGDAHKAELLLIYDRSRLYEVKIQAQDSLIATQSTKLVNMENLVNIKNKQIQVNEDVILKLKKDLERSNKRHKISNILTGIGIGTVLTLILIK